MKTFIIIWLGQTVSTIGTSMTGFAFTIWVWQLTGQATTLALFGFFSIMPQALLTPVAGVIVDRWNRKLLMMLGDMVSGLLTITVLLLHLNNALQLWHLYMAVTIIAIFSPFQKLAFSASISMMVPKQQYSRASSMGFLATSSSSIVAPALAGVVYANIGLVGILIIDITTFAIAMSTVVLVNIPQPKILEVDTQSRTNLKQDLRFGWRYIVTRQSLLTILVLESLYFFAMGLLASLYAPLILARTGNDTKVLGTVSSASGLGGVIGALFISLWGGPKRRIDGWLLGIVSAGLGETVFGLGGILLVWISGKLCSYINQSLLGSSIDAIWQAKVKPEVQGRVFATQRVMIIVTSAVASLIAGPLADYVFEPAMMPNGSLAPRLGWIFGTGKGAGMALLYIISSLGLLVIGLSGYAFRTLRDVENIIPDHDAGAG